MTGDGREFEKCNGGKNAVLTDGFNVENQGKESRMMHPRPDDI